MKVKREIFIRKLEKIRKIKWKNVYKNVKII